MAISLIEQRDPLVLFSHNHGGLARGFGNAGVYMTEITIEKLGAQGDGIGYLDGAEVFAPYTVPGERVEGDIVDGRMAKPRILEPVPNRVKAPCSHFKTCGGCITQHIDGAFLADWKTTIVTDALAKQGLTTEVLPILTSPPHSRRRAVFTGKRTKSGAFLGFHMRGSDQIVQINQCHLLHPDISKGFDGLIELVQRAASRKSEVRLSVTTSLGGLDISVTDAVPLTGDAQSEVVQIAHRHGFSRVYWNPQNNGSGRHLSRPPMGRFCRPRKTVKMRW